MLSLQPYEGPKDDGSRVVGFVFEGKQIRAFEYQGEPHFVGSDVAAALGYSRPTNALDRHCKALKRLNYPETVQLNLSLEGQNLRGLPIIPERDVYRLIMGSKLPSAEAFEEKVVGEILPAIRKTGGYIAAAPSDTPEVIMAKALLVAQDTMQRQTAQLAQAAAEITTLTPKAGAFDQITRGNFLPSINKFCRTLEGVNLGAVNARLVELGYLYRDSSLRDAYRVRRSHPKAAVFFREHVSQREGWANVTISLRPEGQAMISTLYVSGKLPLTLAFQRARNTE